LNVEEATLPIDLAVVQARPQFSRLSLVNPACLASGEIEKMEAAAQR
jgi:hypothetical protein